MKAKNLGATIIIQNPDGSIQLGTQSNLKNKKILECYKCNQKFVK